VKNKTEIMQHVLETQVDFLVVSIYEFLEVFLHDFTYVNTDNLKVICVTSYACMCYTNINIYGYSQSFLFTNWCTRELL